ncbi:MAG: ATP-binding protein [Anaerolineales bacterium]|nr:ATP-binding protein [Anaerolineales bacterium]
MKQLVILSGKGGTGKTSVTAALAHLATSGPQPVRTVLADADVDAANLELVLAPQELSREEFWGGQVAQIDADLCAGCGTCEAVCRFEAVSAANGYYQVDPIACEGCAACLYQCPEGAIQMQPQMAGAWFHSHSRYGPLFHAALRPAQENSGKLVTVVKQQARLLALDEDYELVLVDGPPGIGCPVISALSGADLALIVTEPTVSGAHDLQRILETAWHFGVKTLVCLNKADLYPGANAPLQAFCQAQGLELVGEIPFDPVVTEAMTQGQPVTAYRPNAPASQALESTWQRLKVVLQENY